MIVLFILGLLGIKAAIIAFVIFKFMEAVTKKGDSIKQGYEDKIATLEQENETLKRHSRKESKARRVRGDRKNSALHPWNANPQLWEDYRN